MTRVEKGTKEEQREKLLATLLGTSDDFDGESRMISKKTKTDTSSRKKARNSKNVSGKKKKQRKLNKESETKTAVPKKSNSSSSSEDTTSDAATADGAPLSSELRKLKAEKKKEEIALGVLKALEPTSLLEKLIIDKLRESKKKEVQEVDEKIQRLNSPDSSSAAPGNLTPPMIKTPAGTPPGGSPVKERDVKRESPEKGRNDDREGEKEGNRESDDEKEGNSSVAKVEDKFTKSRDYGSTGKAILGDLDRMVMEIEGCGKATVDPKAAAPTNEDSESVSPKKEEKSSGASDSPSKEQPLALQNGTVPELASGANTNSSSPGESLSSAENSLSDSLVDLESLVAVKELEDDVRTFAFDDESWGQDERLDLMLTYLRKVIHVLLLEVQFLRWRQRKERDISINANRL
jgi:hypothetical protein